MNKNTIKQLLNKSNLTGDEIGRLSILSSINQINTYKEKKCWGAKLTPLISNEEIDSALNQIRGQAHQLSIYNSYIGLENLASHLYGFLLAYQQQIENGFYRIMLELTLDLWELDKKEYKDNLPLIMTEERFKKEQEEAHKDYIEGEASYYDLFFRALWAYDEVQDKETLISKVFNNYKDIPVENETLIKLYKEKFLHTNFCCTEGDGYYTLTDGRDSQTVTLEEYIEDFFKRPLLKKLKAGDKINIKERFYNEMNGCTGASGIFNILEGKENPLSEENSKRLLELKELRKPTTPAEPIRVYEFIEAVRNYFTLKEDTEDFIEELNQLEADSFVLTYKVDKQDLILDNSFIYYLYVDNEDNAEVFELYLKELPELENILNKDIAEKLGVKSIDYFEADKGKKTKRINYFKPLISWEEIYNKNLYGFKDNAGWYNQIQCGAQAKRNGIAIVKESTLFKSYKEKHFKEGLYDYNTDLSRYPEHIQHLCIKNDNNIKNIVNDYVIEGFKYVYAILALLEDIETVHHLEGFKKAYGFPISATEAEVTLFNYFKWDIRERLNETINKDTLLKLEESIDYIDFKALQPSEEIRTKARETIVNIEVFKGAGHKVNSFLSLYFSNDATEPNAEVI